MSGYSVFSRYYDVLTGNVDYTARAQYFSSLIKQFMPQAQLLLDLACGTGRLTQELALLGYDTIGIDSSPDMLSVAMQREMPEDVSVLYLCQPMQKLNLYGTVDVTVCALDSLNHITDSRILRQSVEKVSLFTNPGGLFLFDVNTVYKHRAVLANNTFIYDLPGIYCAWQNTLHKETDIVDIELDFFEKQPDGAYVRHRESFGERAYSQESLTQLLEQTGFSVEAVYHEDSLLPPKEDSQRLVFVAKRNPW